MRLYISVLAAAPVALALAPSQSLSTAGSTAVMPVVRGTGQVIANVTDPTVTRDSCGSVRLGDRALWVCRDTQGYNATTQHFGPPFIPNTASWTNFSTDGTPAIVDNAPVGIASNGSNPVLLMYGGHVHAYPSFYPVASDECPESGICANGSRYAIWPNAPPMVANTTDDGMVTAYTWISQNYEKDLTLLRSNQPFILYKFSYLPSSSNASTPSATIVDEQFWKHDEWGYGAYGNVVQDGIAYLYATDQNHTHVALAKVPTNAIEDRSQYQYYTAGGWTSTMPSLNDSSAYLENAGTTRQGNFYYSDAFNSYIWIGQAAKAQGKADFVLTTSPAPEGPWIEPYAIYSGANGDSGFDSYSLQANPALLKNSSQDKAIYLTWTQTLAVAEGSIYVTPLVYLEFE